MIRTRADAFEVVARIYYLLNDELASKPKINLLGIGRDEFGLSKADFQRVTTRAKVWVKRRKEKTCGFGKPDRWVN